MKKKQENVVEKRKTGKKLVNIGVWQHAVNTMIVYEMKVLPPIIVLIVMISDIKIEREKIVLGLVKKKQENVVERKKKVGKWVNIGVWKHAGNTMIVKKDIKIFIHIL